MIFGQIGCCRGVCARSTGETTAETPVLAASAFSLLNGEPPEKTFLVVHSVGDNGGNEYIGLLFSSRQIGARRAFACHISRAFSGGVPALR